MSGIPNHPIADERGTSAKGGDGDASAFPVLEHFDDLVDGSNEASCHQHRANLSFGRVKIALESGRQWHRVNCLSLFGACLYWMKISCIGYLLTC